MGKVTVTFDLDELRERLDEAVARADRLDSEGVVVDRSTWVMARSLCDEVEKLIGLLPERYKPKPVDCPGCSTDGSNFLGLTGHLPDCIYNPMREEP